MQGTRRVHRRCVQESCHDTLAVGVWVSQRPTVKSKTRGLAVLPVQAAVLSLPPAPADAAPTLPTPYPDPVMVPVKKPIQVMERNSVMRKKAVAIVAMRAAGYTTEEIATELKIKPGSVATYVYQATRAGFLVNRSGSNMLADPKDQLEFQLSHKIVRNLSAALDNKPITTDDGEIMRLSKTQRETTMEIAKGTLFKRFDTPKEVAAPSMNVLSVKIEMPTTGGVDARHGAIGGVGAYTEGEVDE